MKKFEKGDLMVVVQKTAEDKFRVLAIDKGISVYDEEFNTEGVAEHMAKTMTDDAHAAWPERKDLESVKLEFKVSEELVKDILTIAVEGGSNYWGSFSILQGASDNYTAVTVKDCTGEEATDLLPNIVTLNTLRDGLELAVKPGSMREDLREACVKALSEDDACYMDADSADCVLQLGLFGEIIFG